MSMRTHLYMMVAICVVALTSLCAGPPERPQTFPVYKGSTEYSVPSYYYQMLSIPSERVTVKTYFVEGSDAKEILEWYKSELSRLGYEIVQEPVPQTISTPEGSVQWGVLLSKKGENGIGIWAVSPAMVKEKRGVVYWVVEGKFQELKPSETPPKGEKLPSSDVVSGEEPIQRYPKSVMLSHQKIEGFPTIILIDYGTMDNFQTVAEWYKRDLQSKGWSVKDEGKSAEKISMELVKAQEDVGVIIYAPTSERSYTSISVHYGLYKLPSKDVVSGSEPMQRYPGSIMLKYSSMSYMGVKIVSITYGTHDNVDRVASWYNSYLASNSWQVAMTSEADGAKSFTCAKGNAMISLTISPKAGYTEIEMTYQGG